MVIRLEDIHKSYGKKTALEGITLDAGPGQVIGYIGPNGAGKTTTVKILTATLKPDRGSVRILGFDPARDPVAVKRRVGYVPETAALYESMTPVEFGRFAGRLHGLSEDVIERRIKAFLAIFGLEAHSHDRMAAFSKGMKQKVLILTALLHNPPLLILDEPLAGLDANAALLLKEIIARLAARGRTVFYCSHILDVVEKVCHRVVILEKGRILADGTVEEIRSGVGGGGLEAAFSALTSRADHAGLAEELAALLDEDGPPAGSLDP